MNRTTQQWLINLSDDAARAKGIILATEAINDTERAMMSVSNKTDELVRASFGETESALSRGSHDTLYSAEAFMFFTWY